MFELFELITDAIKLNFPDVFVRSAFWLRHKKRNITKMRWKGAEGERKGRGEIKRWMPIHVNNASERNEEILSISNNISLTCVVFCVFVYEWRQIGEHLLMTFHFLECWRDAVHDDFDESFHASK